MKYCAQSALTSSWKLSVLRPCSLTSTGTISFKSWLSIVHPNSAFGFCLHSAHPSSLRSARTRGEHMRFKSSLVLQLHKVKRTIFCWTLKGQQYSWQWTAMVRMLCKLLLSTFVKNDFRVWLKNWLLQTRPCFRWRVIVTGYVLSKPWSINVKAIVCPCSKAFVGFHLSWLKIRSETTHFRQWSQLGQKLLIFLSARTVLCCQQRL